MPQEIEVWYLIPALRKELTKSLVKEQKLSQKAVAKILGITDAAVSQYMSNKRGSEIKFSSQDKNKIAVCAKQISKTPKNAQTEFYRLTKSFRGSSCLCAAHKKIDKNLPKACRLCKQ